MTKEAIPLVVSESSKILADSKPLWLAACGILAPLSTIFVTLAPIPTVQSIKKSKQVGSLPLLPYSSMLVNGFTWSVYGFMTQEPKLIIPNVVATMLGSYYSLIYTKNCPKTATHLPGTLSQQKRTSAFIMTIVLILSSLSSNLYKNYSLNAAKIIGFMGVGFCIMLYASPLAAIKAVIQSKSAKSIPLPFTLAVLVNCILWVIVGVLDIKDILVTAPCVLGLVFSIVQVLLKVVYQSDHIQSGADLKMA